MSYSSVIKSFRFSTTDYSIVELASAAKLTQYFLPGIDFFFTKHIANILTESTNFLSEAFQIRLLWYSSGRAVISDTLPKSNTRFG